MAQLASQQVATETQQVQQPVQVQAQVVNQQASAPVQSVPYNRFQEVIQQKNQLAQEIEALRAQVQPQTMTQQPASQINTVDDLMNVVRSDVRKELDQAYQQKLKPIEDQIQRSNLVANVERFYAGNPEVAKVRGQIDQVFDTLTPEYQRFIKGSVSKGDYTPLNNLYYAVIANNRTQSNQVVQQSVQQQANLAGSPSPFMSVQPTPVSLTEQIQNASKTGAYSGRNSDPWDAIMGQVLAKAS